MLSTLQAPVHYVLTGAGAMSSATAFHPFLTSEFFCCKRMSPHRNEMRARRIAAACKCNMLHVRQAQNCQLINVINVTAAAGYTVQLTTASCAAPLR